MTTTSDTTLGDPTVATSTGELWRWSAAELAAAIASRQVSSREAVASCLARIAEVNPVLNALPDVYADDALAAADLADRVVAAGLELGPLHGVPTAMKDNTDEVGRATTNGVPAHAAAVAATDSAPTANLRRAGAIFVGRSNVPAFSFRWITDNDLHGRTLNPWDAGRTPGGSSGGAASAVAAGMVPVAHGNDIGGSIRYPSYACGLVGLRPTAGRIASSSPPGIDVPLTAHLFAVDGPIARSIEDLRLAYRGMLGDDPRDPFHAHGAAAPPSRHPRRVGLVRSVGIAVPVAGVNAALDRAATVLTAGGYEVEEIELPLLAEAYRLWYLLVPEELRPIRAMVEGLGGTGLQQSLAGTFACAEDFWGPAPTLEQFITGFARRSTLVAQLAAFMTDFPVVVMPVSTEPAFAQDEDLRGVERARSMAAAQWSQMAVPTLGFPALAVPTGLSAGLPTGVQLLGRRFDEETLLGAGAVIEAGTGLLTPIDPRATATG